MGLQVSPPLTIPILWYGEPDQGFATARVTSPFAQRSDGFHGALDIGNAREGDALVACFDGVVHAAGYLGLPWSQPTTLYPSGNYGGMMVVIRSGDIYAIYAHMQPTLAVTAGAPVKRGQLLGRVGSTGAASVGGAHVHFGLQAPLARVPAGVATHATFYGIGLDVDPWPFIHSGVEFDTEADPMLRYRGSQFTKPAGARDYVTTTACHFRASNTRASDSLDVIPAGTPIYVAFLLDGEMIGTNDQWAAAFVYLAETQYWTMGFFHTSVLAEPAPVAPQVVEKVVVDQIAIDNAVRTASGAYEERIARIKSKTKAFATDIADD